MSNATKPGPRMESISRKELLIYKLGTVGFGVLLVGMWLWYQSNVIFGPQEAQSKIVVSLYVNGTAESQHMVAVVDDIAKRCDGIVSFRTIDVVKEPERAKAELIQATGHDVEERWLPYVVVERVDYDHQGKRYGYMNNCSHMTDGDKVIQYIIGLAHSGDQRLEPVPFNINRQGSAPTQKP